MILFLQKGTTCTQPTKRQHEKNQKTIHSEIEREKDSWDSRKAWQAVPRYNRTHAHTHTHTRHTHAHTSTAVNINSSWLFFLFLYLNIFTQTLENERHVPSIGYFNFTPSVQGEMIGHRAVVKLLNTKSSMQ